MRILIVTQYFWPEEFRINDIVKYFTKKGNQVDVINAEKSVMLGSLPAAKERFLSRRHQKNKRNSSRFGQTVPPVYSSNGFLTSSLLKRQQKHSSVTSERSVVPISFPRPILPRSVLETWRLSISSPGIMPSFRTDSWLLIRNMWM